MQNPSSAPVPILSGIASLADETTAWLVDIWGVMHNGLAPFEPAGLACARFREKGGRVILLSNAPRPAGAVAAQLERIGVSRVAWDAIISSGDATRTSLAAEAEGSVFHLGPDRDLPLYDGLGVTLTDEAQASRVVCTGLFDDETETPADYAPMLTGLAARDVAMICANPDLTVERGGKLVYCAGAIAAAYEALGGRVMYAGKPYGPIYDMACDWLNSVVGTEVPKSRILAIGDGVRTDILGAARYGIRSVYIASGVSLPAGRELDCESLAELFPDKAVQPVGAMTALAW